MKKLLPAALWFILALVVVAVFFVAMDAVLGKAGAHDFYDPGCCDTTHCHSQRLGESVILTATGWLVQVPAEGIHDLVGFDDERLRDTPMDAVVPFHICIYPRHVLRCFYRPGAAG